MQIESLIETGRPMEAWEAIQQLPRRALFSNEVLQLQLACATALGWERKARLLKEVLAKSIDESMRVRGVARNRFGSKTPATSRRDRGGIP
jgi:hypothetical protein